MYGTPLPSGSSETLARLEARVRWLGALTTFLSLGFVGLLAWEFFPRTSLVEAHRFVLRDPEWRRRAELGFREDGSPGLKLFDPSGRTRASFYLPHDGAATLRMNDAHGKDRLRLGLQPDATPVLALRQEDGTVGVYVTADEAGRPALRIEKGGRVLWQALE